MHLSLDDVYWREVQRGIRGRGAKGKRPFVAAVSMNGEGHPISMRFSVVTGFKIIPLSDRFTLSIIDFWHSIEQFL